MVKLTKENILFTLFVLFVMGITISPTLFPGFFNPIVEFIRMEATSFGVFTPLILIIMLVVATVITPIPQSLIIITIGAIYGPVAGFALALVGGVLAASTAFIVARTFGRDVVRRFLPQTHSFYQFFEKNAAWFVFVLRLIPTVSFDLVSYAAGLTKLRYFPFVTATFFGMMPATLSFVLIGAGITETGFYSYVGLALFLILMAVGFFVSKKYMDGANGKKI
ncbi:MAG: TVP38/TMEM64 family protein [Candidatus Diapherotrites archaeon]|nr:TVP38/TMEM64 family protein [Candidatus Diapherotrites archaeon]MDZ4256527.1 TVP38/TMEM64 family protein [archaeon]